MSGLSEQDYDTLEGGIIEWENRGGPIIDALIPAVEAIVAARVAAAREEAAAKVEALAAAYVRAGDRETRRRSYAQGVAWRGAAQGLRDLAADIRKGDDRG